MSEKSLKFTCPNCYEKRLECIETNATVSYVLKDIVEDGNFEYGDTIVQESEIDRYECVDCGYVLKDEFGDKLNENTEVVDWIKAQS